jgi:hypothetical protein
MCTGGSGSMRLVSVVIPLVKLMLRGVRTTYETVKLVENLKHAVISALLIFHRFQVLATSEVDRPVDQVKLVFRDAYTVVCSSQ